MWSSRGVKGPCQGGLKGVGEANFPHFLVPGIFGMFGKFAVTTDENGDVAAGAHPSRLRNLHHNRWNTLTPNRHYATPRPKGTRHPVPGPVRSARGSLLCRAFSLLRSEGATSRKGLE